MAEDDNIKELRDLLILLLLKSGISYEVIADVIRTNEKTLRNRFPLNKIIRKAENEDLNPFYRIK